MQPAGELADVLEAAGELVDRLVEQLGSLGRRLADTPEREQYPGEPLLGAVVEVPLDPLALLVGDLDQPRAGGEQRLLGANTVVMSRM